MDCFEIFLKCTPKNKLPFGFKRFVLRMVVDVIQLLDALPEATWTLFKEIFQIFRGENVPVEWSLEPR